MTATFKPEQMLSSWSRRTGPERLKFVLLPELFLDPALVKAARLGHRFACLHLGLEDPPTLGFYELQGVSEPSYRQKQYQPSAAMAFVGGDHAGHADRDSWSVGVRMDTHGGKSWLAEVAAHEVRHLAQSKDDEDDAKAYGRWAAGVLRRDHHGGLVNVYAWSAAVPNLALYGEAEPEDIIIAKERGKTTVWRNSAPRGSIRWVEYYPRCPV